MGFKIEEAQKAARVTRATPKALDWLAAQRISRTAVQPSCSPPPQHLDQRGSLQLHNSGSTLAPSTITPSCAPDQIERALSTTELISKLHYLAWKKGDTQGIFSEHTHQCFDYLQPSAVSPSFAKGALLFTPGADLQLWTQQAFATGGRHFLLLFRGPQQLKHAMRCIHQYSPHLYLTPNPSQENAATYQVFKKTDLGQSRLLHWTLRS